VPVTSTSNKRGPARQVSGIFVHAPPLRTSEGEVGPRSCGPRWPTRQTDPVLEAKAVNDNQAFLDQPRRGPTYDELSAIGLPSAPPAPTL
jgi:hypothetical protein